MSVSRQRVLARMYADRRFHLAVLEVVGFMILASASFFEGNVLSAAVCAVLGPAIAVTLVVVHYRRTADRLREQVKS